MMPNITKEIQSKLGSRIEVISKEMIKPSSPTPKSLRDYKMSFLDQIAPPFYIPLICFYQPENRDEVSRTQISQQLKQSLSNILNLYYPLSGRFNGKFALHCDDSGVEYIETRVHTQLEPVIEEACVEEMRNYLPIQAHRRRVEDIPLAIQVNFFDCGGIAISACLSHTVGDGLSFVSFMNAWAAMCRGDHSKVVKPLFDSATYFPPKDLSLFDSSDDYGIVLEKIVTRRLVFDKEKLAILKAIVASSEVKDPSKFESVTAHIWRQMIAGKIDNKMYFGASFPVEFRSRMNPSVPAHTFGNLWEQRCTVLKPEEDKDFPNMVSSLRHKIREFTRDYVEKLHHGDEYMKYAGKPKELYNSKDVVYCNFSSWSRFPVYEVDYGWGKPVWVSFTTFPFKNCTIFLSTKCGEGIEAFVNFSEDDDVPVLHSDPNYG